jgi:hypothetical protein
MIAPFGLVAESGVTSGDLVYTDTLRDTSASK